MSTNLDLMVFAQEIFYLKQKIGGYVINLEEYERSIVNGDNVTIFNNFGVECISKEI